MRRMFAGLTVAAFAVVMAVPVFAKTETITGQIVDQTCYMKDKANNGATHNMSGKEVADCAAGCAKKGAPLALLTSDGKVYTIGGALAADTNAKLIPHISHTVEVTGDVTEKDGKMMIASDALKMIKR
jgi:type 1 fimbria pilin